MPERYHVHTIPTPARFRRIGKSGTTDWREDCSRCKNCVKLRCLYGVYRSESAANRAPEAPLQPPFECKSCLSCVQGCTKGLLSLAINPEYLALGDGYWRPDILSTTWDQAESGRIPVSGAGYRGPFSGPGFDSMWTDMSEIVRPTRDGIHGREYINTSVDIGPKPMRLAFEEDGALKEAFSLIEIPIPLILDAAPWGDPGEGILQARISAAAALRTLAVVPAGRLPAAGPDRHPFVVPLFEGEKALSARDLPPGVRLAEVADGPDAVPAARKLQEGARHLMVAVRLPLRPDAIARAMELRGQGVRILHLVADRNGREIGADHPRFVKDVLRELHGALVQGGGRDEMTIIAGGGIALAEHMAKAIICGADLVSVDVAPLVSLGCRVCAGDHGKGCPAGLGDAEPSYAAQRVVNLMGAWHSQMIEVLGAMGIREVRRLRGETGRAMFLEDLERDAFRELVRIPRARAGKERAC